MSQCKTTTKPRSGLKACATLSLNPTIQTAVTSSLNSTASFTLFGNTSVLMAPAIWQGTYEVSLDNTQDVSAVLITRAIPVQSPRSDVETLWVLNNIGPGAECCDLDATSGGGGTGNASITIVPTTVLENVIAATLDATDSGFLLFNEETGTLKIWTGQAFSDTVTNNGTNDCGDLDGGFANSTYLTTQVYTGGDANG